MSIPICPDHYSAENMRRIAAFQIDRLHATRARSADPRRHVECDQAIAQWVEIAKVASPYRITKPQLEMFNDALMRQESFALSMKAMIRSFTDIMGEMGTDGE